MQGGNAGQPICASTHWRSAEGGKAPDRLSISRPFLNINKAGTPCTPYRAASSGALSISTLANLARGSIAIVTWANDGAMARQGPHHVAQKSTTTGMSDRVIWRSNLWPSRSTGEPLNSALWHLPHFAAWAGRSGGIALTASQCGQTTLILSASIRRPSLACRALALLISGMQ